MTNQLIEKQLSVNEHSIRYLEGGIASDSEPILFLHGWGVGVEPYQEILNILCQRYQVIAPELPGFGKTSHSNLNWDYNDYAMFLITFLNILSIKKVHIIGHSLGGGIAATIAASMPTFVQSIILVDSTGIPVEPLAKILFQRAIEMTAQTPQLKFPQIIQIFTAFTSNFLLQTQNTIQLLLLALKKD